ncbi:MAG: histidine triad nucleotide-binding protein [Chloroflexi bacterium RBG_16_51_16]|nr:MAG: histidine triad nucleotide-binding protein [Chloroflexi bacterium RBG_16_51_16]
MPPCLFCQIIAREIPADILSQDESLTAFRDIHPQAPTHILIVPNKHIVSTNDVQPEDQELIGSMFTLAAQLAHQEKIDQSGYRLVVNNGRGAGQSVFHLHFHLLGGRPMHWPPG